MSLEQFLDTTCDKMCLDVIETNINMTVPWFLMAAYAYYVEDEPILSDASFDRMVHRMIDNWDKIEHRHKELITLDMLKAGTYLGTYPPMVEGAVKEIRQTNSPKKKRKGVYVNPPMR